MAVPWLMLAGLGMGALQGQEQQKLHKQQLRLASAERRNRWITGKDTQHHGGMPGMMGPVMQGGMAGMMMQQQLADQNFWQDMMKKKHGMDEGGGYNAGVNVS